jgi:hypothetical protein
MQMIAKGKWSKQMKRWTKVVALRRPTTEDNNRRRPPVKHGERPQGR